MGNGNENPDNDEPEDGEDAASEEEEEVDHGDDGLESPRSGPITVNVPHILDLLVRDLYGSDPHLTIRELVQNAHDALVDIPSEKHDDRSIIIRVNALRIPKYIDVVDNGHGMTVREIEQNLCIVNNSEKLRNPSKIGRFGIGFLSSFIIADRVEVTTRRIGAKTAYHWETTDRETWQLTEYRGDFLPHGTRVRLYFKDHYPADYQERIFDLQTVDGVEAVVQRYCYLVPFPIQIGRSSDEHEIPRRANCLVPPWQDDVEALNAHKVLFDSNEPLFVRTFEELDEESGLTAQGVLYIKDEIEKYPSLSLYVQRMLVDPEDHRLLPPYAAFIQGIVECPKLNVDLSRRHISTFDPHYRWLQRVVSSNFEQMFIDFAKKKSTDFFKLWPNIEGFVVPRLLNELNSQNDLSKETAESFVRAAAIYIPFFVVDTKIGAQGRPAWKTIGEIMGRRRQADGSPVVIHYTDSANAVEKDMLINTYSEIIDVGRTERPSHAAMIAAIHARGKYFSDFQLDKVAANRFDPIDPAEEKDWRWVTRIVQTKLAFGATHDVMVARFYPASTPVVITASNVDENDLNRVQEELEQWKTNPRLEPMYRQFSKALAVMQGRGGMLTVHINADNELMRQIVSSDQRDVAELGLMTVCWRAAVDYFGWNSTRDMLSIEKQYTASLINQLLDATAESARLRADGQQNRALADRRQEEIERVQRELEQERSRWVVENSGRRIIAIVGFVDFVDSTRRIVGNRAAGPAEVERFLQLVTSGLAERLRKFGEVIAFTGDGLQFYLTASPEDQTPNRMRVLNGLSESIKDLCEENRELREMMSKTRQEPPRLRVALAAGEILVGPVVTPQDVIGLPAVEASRLCSMKSLYQEHETDLLVTVDAYNRGAEWRLWSAADFTEAQTVEFAGLEGRRVGIYRPRAEIVR